jgi:hypothetical protein
MGDNMLTTLPNTPATTISGRPVSAAEVHKLDATEVLLSDWQQVDADRFSISAQWPAHHRFYAGAHGCRDVLMLVESRYRCSATPPTMRRSVFGRRGSTCASPSSPRCSPEPTRP